MPKIPCRIYSLLPDVKIIFLLRNPVDRVISHFRHNVRHGWEHRSIKEAINENRGLTDYQRDNHLKLKIRPYLDKSNYGPQIKRYKALFRDDQLMFIKSENMFKDTLNAVNSVCDFLNIDSLEKSRFQVKNKGSGSFAITQSTRDYIKDALHGTESDVRRETGIWWNN